MNSTDTPQPAIAVDGLKKSFGDTDALSGLSFTVGAGEILGLLGPNGAGKTTAINVLSTLIAPNAGTVVVGGHDITTDGHLVRRAISMTGQFAAVDEMLSGHENLLLFGRLRGLSRADAAQRADELLAAFDLADAGERKVSTYSGGMRRRLDIGCSLVVEPEILFLDEPTTGLDPRSRNDLWQIVRQLRADGMTIVLTTQYLEEADQLADRVVVIDNGRSIAEGTPSELKEMVGGATCVLSVFDAASLDRAADTVADLGDTSIDREQSCVNIAATEGVDTLTRAIGALREAGIDVQTAAIRQPTLDEVFLTLTEGHAA